VSRGGRCAWVAAVVLGAGCVVPSPPAESDRSRPPPPSAVTAEVEVGGTVKRPAAIKGDVEVWVTDGPCWQPTTHAYGVSKANNDRFFVDVFVPQGATLWVCAGIVDGDKPLTVYGQADRAPALGKGLGQVTFTDLVVPLQKGRTVAAPAAAATKKEK